MNEFNIALDVDKLTRAQPPVVIAQGDRNGTTIVAKVYDHGTLLTQSGLSARFKMRLPDGRYFYSKAATWTASTGTVSVTIDETQAASAVGTTTGAYFELMNGTTVVYSTSRFTVRVLRSATDMSAQADSYDDRVEEIIAAMDVAVEAVEDAQEAAASANSAAASATSAATNANTARDNANSAASAANSAASTATSAAASANDAASNANGAAQTANAAATSANDAAANANDAAERAEAIAEYSVPLMSPTTRGGARLGSGLAMDGDVLSVALDAESDGTGAGPIVELTAKGHAEQDTTTGKNLLELPSETETKNGVTMVKTTEPRITLSGTSTNSAAFIIGNTTILNLASDTTYTLSLTDAITNGYVQVNCTFEDASTVRLARTSREPVTFTVPSNVTLVYFFVGVSGAGEASADVRVQLELGSTATSYEPYSGGAPSPSPDYPQEIQVARGHEVTGKTGRFVDLVVKQGDTTLSTTPIPLPSRGWVGALPDGTADTLTLDGAGKVVWERATNEVTLNGGENWRTHASNTATYYIDIANGRSGTPQKAMCDSYLASNETISALPDKSMRYGSSTGNALFIRDTTNGDTVENFESWLSTHPVTVLYPLATPVTEDMGYVDLPEIPEGASLSIPELDALNVRYVVDDAAVTLARQWYERARSEYEGRLSTLESIVAGLV